MTAPEVYVTGLGIVSPTGIGKQAFLEGLLAGRRHLGRLQGLDVEGFRIGMGGEVELASNGANAGRALTFALRAAQEALEDAAIELPDDATFALGSGAGEMRVMEESLSPPEDALLDLSDPLQAPNSITTKLARRLGLRGRQITFVNACAAGAQAIAVAADLIRSGRAQVALAGGVEILNRMVLSGFEALRAVSSEGPRPFDADRDGIQLSELAAFIVLESSARVTERGASPYARFAGSGASADAFPVVRPHERGAGAV
ncbi:MAG: beta-ketoacyl synthase N-terminal-like domain-containing protein, partial [Dehalococcoidia bacterium]